MASFSSEYHPHLLFFTQQLHIPLGDTYIHKNTLNPTPKYPFFWPELESGQNELQSGQNETDMGNLYKKWATVL